MAIITCPECGQNPVSDRATSCPKCGCPIAAGTTPVAPINPASESPPQVPTIRQERQAQLPSGSYMGDSDEFADACVGLSNPADVDLRKLVENIQGWCEELKIAIGARSHHMAAISRLSRLKSLSITSGELDDEALLYISKLQTLSRLKILMNDARTSASGWLQLGKLRRLELLVLGSTAFRSWDEREKIMQELRKRLPDTIIK